MKTAKTVRTLAATLTIIGSLAGGATAGVTYVEDTPTTTSYMEPAGLQKGDWLLGFAASYNHIGIDSTDVDLFLALVEADYFVTDNISIGAAGLGLLADVEGLGDITAFGIEPHVRYYFNQMGSFLPYVGVHGGILDFDLDPDFGGSFGSEVYTYGAHAGALIPVTEGAYVDLQLKWTEWELDEDDFGGNDIDLDSLQVIAGIKVQF